MLKCIAVIVLFFGTMVPCFSWENETSLQNEVIDAFEAGLDSPPALYTSCGYLHLLVKNYTFALEDFRQVASFLTQSNVPMPEVQLLVSFGQAVAYDNLNMRVHCEQALDSLFLALEDLSLDGDDDDDDDAGESESTSFLTEAMLHMMQKVAYLAPSSDVRSALVSLVEGDVEDAS